MLKFVSFSVLGTLVFTSSASASVEWKDKLYQQSNGRVVQSVKNAKGAWVERVSLPEDGEGSFNELWCRAADGYCPRGVAAKLREASQLFDSYEQQSRDAKTSLARQRAKREAEAAQTVCSKYEADQELFVELVEDYLKAPVPFHFDESKDKAYLEIVRVWSDVFEQAVEQKDRLDTLARLNLKFACVASCDGQLLYSNTLFNPTEERACRATLKGEEECKENYSFLFVPYLDGERIRRESQEFKKNRDYWQETGIVSDKAEENERIISNSRIALLTPVIHQINSRQFSRKAAKLLCQSLGLEKERFIYFKNSNTPMEVSSVALKSYEVPVGATCESVFLSSESSQILPRNTEQDYRNYALTTEDLRRFKEARGY